MMRKQAIAVFAGSASLLSFLKGALVAGQQRAALGYATPAHRQCRHKMIRFLARRYAD